MSKLVLYYSPGACSLAAHIALYEWGVPFEARRVTIADREHLQPDYLDINPRGRVPTLLIDARPARELSGILTWIGRQCGLYPEDGSYEAARCGEWLGWLTSAVHISFAMLWRGERFLSDARLFPLLRARGYDWLREQFAEIEASLSPGPFALGDLYSVADCNLVPFYRWGWRVGVDMRRECPRWSAHTERMLERTAVAKALGAEGVDLRQPVKLGPAPATPRASQEALAAFDAAWTAGDLDALMKCVAPDCVYSASVGPESGETFNGAEQVRRGFAKMLAHDAGRARQSGESWVLGDVAFAEWSFEEAGPGGARVIRGIDRLEFSDDGVVRKDAFRKTTTG
jgi:glutathione S-transferase